jgi:hypothetical protein
MVLGCRGSAQDGERGATAGIVVEYGTGGVVASELRDGKATRLIGLLRRLVWRAHPGRWGAGDSASVRLSPASPKRHLIWTRNHLPALSWKTCSRSHCPCIRLHMPSGPRPFVKWHLRKSSQTACSALPLPPPEPLPASDHDQASCICASRRRLDATNLLHARSDELPSLLLDAPMRTNHPLPHGNADTIAHRQQVRAQGRHRPGHRLLVHVRVLSSDAAGP